MIAINDIKQKILNVTGMATEMQRIIYNDKALEDNSRSLERYSIPPDSTLFLVRI